MVEIDIKKAIQELKKEHRSLTKDQISAATVSALNHTLNKTRTQASKSIRQTYKVKAKVVRKNFDITKARKARHWAILQAVTKPLPVAAFSPRQRKDGVSVRVRNTRTVIKSAFFARGRRGGGGTSKGVAELGTSGHLGVFGRAKYEGNKLQWRKRRLTRKGNDLPITEIKTVSVSSAATHFTVLHALQSQMSDDFPNRLAHEFTRRSAR
jgi:hypothetical protein